MTEEQFAAITERLDNLTRRLATQRALDHCTECRKVDQEREKANGARLEARLARERELLSRALHLILKAPTVRAARKIARDTLFL